MATPELDLYYYDSCPYCQRVLNVINKLKIKVNYKDIHEGTTNLQKLVQITGRRTVPCMFIDGDPMHESMDIMNWLEKNKETLTKA
jgi:glutaredoxin